MDKHVDIAGKLGAKAPMVPKISLQWQFLKILIHVQDWTAMRRWW